LLPESLLPSPLCVLQTEDLARMYRLFQRISKVGSSLGVA
jgi:hypothetical protein